MIITQGQQANLTGGVLPNGEGPTTTTGDLGAQVMSAGSVIDLTEDPMLSLTYEPWELDLNPALSNGSLVGSPGSSPEVQSYSSTGGSSFSGISIVSDTENAPNSFGGPGGYSTPGKMVPGPTSGLGIGILAGEVLGLQSIVSKPNVPIETLGIRNVIGTNSQLVSSLSTEDTTSDSECTVTARDKRKSSVTTEELDFITLVENSSVSSTAIGPIAPPLVLVPGVLPRLGSPSLNTVNESYASSETVTNSDSSQEGGATSVTVAIESALGALSPRFTPVTADQDPLPSPALTFSTQKIQNSFNVNAAASTLSQSPPQPVPVKKAQPRDSDRRTKAESARNSLKQGLSSIESVDTYTPQGASSSGTLTINTIAGIDIKLDISPLDKDPLKSSGQVYRPPPTPTLTVKGSTTDSTTTRDYIAPSTPSGTITALIPKLVIEDALVSEDLLGLSLDPAGVDSFTNTVKIISGGRKVETLETEEESPSIERSLLIKKPLDSDIRGFTTLNSIESERLVGPSGASVKIAINSATPVDLNQDSALLKDVPDDTDDGRTAGQSYTGNISGILKNLSKEAGKNAYLSGTTKNAVIDILRRAGQLAGDPELFKDSTSCYGLVKPQVEFLFFNLMLTVLELTVHSVEMTKDKKKGPAAGNRSPSGDKSFQSVKVKYRKEQVAQDFNLLKVISEFEGQIEDAARKLEGSGIQTDIFDAIRHCIESTSLVKERTAVLESFVNNYAKSVNDLSLLTKSTTARAAIDALTTRNSTSALGEITPETVSAAQLMFSQMRGPLKIPRVTRLTRISENASSIFLREIVKNGGNKSVLATVGLPAKTIETLRRTPNFESDTDFSLEGKEYLQLAFTRRDVGYSDLVYRNASYNFCPRLAVVPQITSAKSLQEASRDYLYLCYEGRQWRTKNFVDAVSFVSNVTGLTKPLSTIIVYNHVIDELGRLTFFGLTGGMIDSSFATPSESILSSAGGNLFLDAMKSSSVSSSITRERLQAGDFLESSDGGYSFIPLSRLSPGVISKTSEPSHRLLGLIARDPLFTYENYYGGSFSFPTFDRVYMCLVSPDDFHVDKSLTTSTRSGNATYLSLVNSGKLKESRDCAVFVESEAFAGMDASEFAVKATMVSG